MTYNAMIIDVVRTPMGRGKEGGALSTVHPVDLLASVLKAIVDRNKIDPGIIDDVIAGCVTQVSEQAHVGRMAVLASGFPVTVPATTIDRKCGSSQQAAHFAAQGVMAGAYKVVIAAGVESMSRVPMGSNRLRMDDAGPSVKARFPSGLISQGVAAELVAAKWEIDREELDSYAERSHQRAHHIRTSGGFAREISGVAVAGSEFLDDETIRPNTTKETLAALKPVFPTDALSERFPNIVWSITAGNSCQLSDGAAAMLIVEEQTAVRLGLHPRARFVAFDVLGDDPLMMLTAPIPVSRRILERSKMTIDQIDHIEVNEAFASVPLAWNRELRADPSRLNPRGGAIALGHPLGCSGLRLMTSMVNGLEHTGGKYGLQTMCEAGGLANATIIERL